MRTLFFALASVNFLVAIGLTVNHNLNLVPFDKTGAYAAMSLGATLLFALIACLADIGRAGKKDRRVHQSFRCGPRFHRRASRAWLAQLDELGSPEEDRPSIFRKVGRAMVPPKLR